MLAALHLGTQSADPIVIRLSSSKAKGPTVIMIAHPAGGCKVAHGAKVVLTDKPMCHSLAEADAMVGSG